jgi:diguanylate cyclase (GGDEF)-like protein
MDRDSIVATYAEVMNSKSVYDSALASLQLQPQEIDDYSYETVIIANSYIIEMQVRGPNPNLAASIANAIGFQTIELMKRLNQVIVLEFLDMAAPPIKPYWPQPLRDSIIAIVFGLLGGMGLAILSEQIRIPWEAFKRQRILDNMTGVYTRKHFSELHEKKLAENPEEVHSVGIVELTGFKDMLEALPITGQQRILQITSNILHRELRGNDLIGRWNDFSFIILLPKTQALAAQRIFERIVEALSEPIKLEMLDFVVNLDAQIGGAEYSNNITAKELYEKAEGALETAQKDKEISSYVWSLKNPFWTQSSVMGNE